MAWHFIEDDHAVEVAAEPVEDLLDARGFLLPFERAQRRVGGEENAFRKPDRRALPKARLWRDQQPLLAERRPVALGILDQLVGLGDPDGAAAALQPVIEQNAGDLAALAGAGAVTEEPAAAETDGIRRVLGCGRYDIEGVVHAPRSGEKTFMGFARIDDAFELGVGEQAFGHNGRGEMRPVAGLRRRDRCHGGRLDEPGRVARRARNADRLERIALVKRFGEAAGLGRGPIDRLIFEFDA